LVPSVCIIVLASPNFFNRWRLLWLLMPTLFLYVALKIRLGYSLLGTGLPVTVTEIASIVISVLIVQRLTSIVSDFEDTMSKLTFRQIGLPPRLFETIDTEELYREVKRCRRYQHPLALMRVEVEDEPDSKIMNLMMQDLQNDMLQRYVQARLAKFLSEELRDIDLIAQHGNGFVIVLPEMDDQDATRLGDIMRSHATSEFGMNLRIGIGAFPKSALTLGGLLDKAQQDLQNQAELRNARDISQPSVNVASPGR